MSQDEIIAMAREANPENDLNSMLQFLQRFAALVAVKEREACAQVCTTRANDEALSNRRRCDADELARSIRARAPASTAQAWEVAGSLDQQGVNHEL